MLFNSLSLTRNGDIWALPLDGNGKQFPVVQTSAEEQGGQFSPDVHWIAFQSNESGRAEIYVQPFPGPEPSGQFPSTVAVRYVGDAMGRNCSTSRWMAGSWPCHSESRRTTQAPEVGTPVALFAPPLGGAVQQGDYRWQYSHGPTCREPACAIGDRSRLRMGVTSDA